MTRRSPNTLTSTLRLLHGLSAHPARPEPHTIRSYRDGLTLLLRFVATHKRRTSSSSMSTISPPTSSSLFYQISKRPATLPSARATSGWRPSTPSSGFWPRSIPTGWSTPSGSSASPSSGPGRGPSSISSTRNRGRPGGGQPHHACAAPRLHLAGHPVQYRSPGAGTPRRLGDRSSADHPGPCPGVRQGRSTASRRRERRRWPTCESVVTDGVVLMTIEPTTPDSRPRSHQSRRSTRSECKPPDRTTGSTSAPIAVRIAEQRQRGTRLRPASRPEGRCRTAP
jgi:hypothetical protein